MNRLYDSIIFSPFPATPEETVNKRLLLVAVVVCCLSIPFSAWAIPKDVLVIGVSSDIHTLDPAVSSDNYDWREIYPCYERLVQYKTRDDKGLTEVEPMLATSWDVSEDGKTWVFQLKPGKTFDDGTPVDAKAVKFSLDRTLAVGKGPAGNINAIDRIEVVDPLTVKIILKNPYGPFLQTLATNGASIVNPAVMSHATGDDLAQGWLASHTDGSGPYRLTTWNRGQHCVLEAKTSPKDGGPAIKKAIIRFMRESADRRMALERGDIDIAENILIDQLPALKDNPAIEVNVYPAQYVEYVYLNNQKSPLNNPTVRRALNYAVDYQGIIDYILQGYGVQMRGPVPAGMWGHDPECFQYHRDPAKARELLKEAGFSNGLTLTLIYSERKASWPQIATILQSNLADIGIDLKLEMMSNPTLRDKVDRGDFQLCLGAWSPDFADPFMFMNFWFDSELWGLPGNRSFYKNDQVDTLIRKAAMISDQEERTSLYHQAQKIIMQEAPYIFLYQRQTVVPMRAGVKGYVYNPMLESMYNFGDIYKN